MTDPRTQEVRTETCGHCADKHNGHRCPCPIGEAKFSYIDKKNPEAIITYTVPMTTYCNGSVRLKI